MRLSPLRCNHCGRTVDFPYTCTRCGKVFCVECHLPEEHDCPALRGKLRLLSFEREICCDYCGKVDLLFKCRYCGGLFCSEHHLPPSHECVRIEYWKARPPPGVVMRYTVGGGGAPRAVSVRGVPTFSGAVEAPGKGESVEEWHRVPVEAPGGGGKKPKGLGSALLSILCVFSLFFSILLGWHTQNYVLSLALLVAAAVALYVVKRFLR